MLLPPQISLGPGRPMTCPHTTGRILLVILVVFLGCLWTLTCFVITTIGVCVVGWCVNASKGRTGGCSDEECEILNKGIKTFNTWNSGGWRELLSWILEEQPPHQEEGGTTIDVREIRYPPPVAVYPSYLPREHMRSI